MTKDNLSFDIAVELAKSETDKVLSGSPLIIREYTKHLMSARGKFIRGEALLACAEGNDGIIKPDAVKLASAVEILHLATIVHDDVIDNAGKRRGIVTLQKKYGKRTAVICGDYLLCIALKQASALSKEQDYSGFDIPDYMSRVCLGELNEHLNNGNVNLSILNYFKIISGKTAALFDASFYAGALLCGTKKEKLGEYAKLGRFIGMIFQLTDDCMDFETSESVAKKPVQSDFEQGVITLPLIYAFEKIRGLRDRAAEGSLERKDINDAVAKAGGLEHTKAVAKKYYTKSMRIMDGLDLSEGKRKRLICILNKALRQDIL